MNYQDQKITVIGAGKTGLSLARYFSARGAGVTLSDQRSREELNLQAMDGVSFDCGGHTERFFTGADLVVASPGVPLDVPPLIAAREAGVPVRGEVDIALKELSGKLIAITGTNGKSTTTSLIGEIFKAWGKKVFVGGNLGTPLIDAVGEAWDYLVVELSSFQLEAIEEMRPDYGVLLNITPDHLDRYPNMEAYVKAKERLFLTMKEQGVAVLNVDDSLVMQAGKWVQKGIGFSCESPLDEGLSLVGEAIRVRLPGIAADLPHNDLLLQGEHNRQNVMAALIPALLEGCPLELAWKAVTAYGGLPHRMQLVARVNEVSYFNDSKGTNVGSVLKSLSGLAAPVSLIAGGLAKGGDFTPLSDLVKDRVVALILMGTDAPLIEDHLGQLTRVIHVSSMKEAVQKAAEVTPKGGSVLLSPGCASFDMFNGMADRGNAFVNAVHALEEAL